MFFRHIKLEIRRPRVPKIRLSKHKMHFMKKLLNYHIIKPILGPQKSHVRSQTTSRCSKMTSRCSKLASRNSRMDLPDDGTVPRGPQGPGECPAVPGEVLSQPPPPSPQPPFGDCALTKRWSFPIYQFLTVRALFSMNLRNFTVPLRHSLLGAKIEQPPGSLIHAIFMDLGFLH